MAGVQAEVCGECGFDGSSLEPDAAAVSLRAAVLEWQRILGEMSGAEAQLRPSPSVWSPIEYAAHTRDVVAANFRAFDVVLNIDGIRSSTPIPTEQDLDSEAIARNYAAESVTEVATVLAERISAFADRAQTAMTGWNHRAWLGSGQEVDPGWILKHAMHEVLHHLRDVREMLKPS